MNPIFRVLCLLAWLGLQLVPATQLAAQSYTNVPGMLLDEVPAPSVMDQILGNDKYVSDPEILVLPNGDYLACHAQFGAGANSDVSGLTTLFRSSDKGTNWTSLGTLTGILRASLVMYNGAVYLMGTDNDVSGVVVVRKSLDNGNTWTSTTDTNTGKFTFGGFGSPNNPIIFNGRLFSAASSGNLSFPIGADPLLQSSWTSGGGPSTSTNWLGGQFTIMTEGQVVASPEQGVVVMPKVGGLPYTALCRVNTNTGSVTFDANYEFVEVPGGEKKFGAGYDPVSGKFYILSNPVLPAHAADTSLTPQLKRNTSAVLSSRDLYNWKFEKIFLYSTHLDYEAFQYLNFDLDGEDMIVASRTAFDVGGNKPPRGHDSNLFTVHRIKNFRTLSPTHVLVLNTAGNQVLRYEKTQHADAPLGKFALGTSFAGAPLTAPNALGQEAATGDVYIRETGGRILRFDAAGNFLQVAATAPVTLATNDLAVLQPPAGECSWAASNSATWNEPLSWYYWGRPDTTSEIAVFGSAATAPVTVTLNGAAPEWAFNTNGDTNGWTTNGSIGDIIVTNGNCTLTITNSDPQFYRTDQNFWGNRFPEIRMRMRANVTLPNLVEMYWGTATTNTFNSSRRVAANYTGNGAWQEIVFPTRGLAQWQGNVIKRLRFDPLAGTTNIGKIVDLDYIRVVPDGLRLKGLRFRNQNAYTLTNSGATLLRLDPDTGPALVDVQLGSHRISLPLVLEQNATFSLSNNAALALNQTFELRGHSLALSGPGNLLINSNLIVDGGELAISNDAVCTLTNGLELATGSTLRFGRGTLAGQVVVDPGASVKPSAAPGTLTIANGYLALKTGSTLTLQLNKTNAQTSDLIVSAQQPFTNSGTLIVTNIGPALTGGEIFTLFSAPSYAGAFASVTLPALSSTNLNWWRGDLTNNGTLAVNRAPVARDAQYARGKGLGLTLNISNLLANSVTDADSNSLALVSLGTSAIGATLATNAANILYTPPTGVSSNASDTFTFRVTDGHGGTNQARIAINVINAIDQFSVVKTSGSNLTLSFNGIAGYDYVLRRSTNLHDWVDLLTTNLPLGPNNTNTIQFADPPTNNRAFYRILKP